MSESTSGLNYCPDRGAYPHAGCETGMYEGGGPWSHIYGACHGHKTIWHLQSGGAAWSDLPTLDELDGKGYVDVTPGPDPLQVEPITDVEPLENGKF